MLNNARIPNWLTGLFHLLFVLEIVRCAGSKMVEKAGFIIE